jgi:protein-S-isoprenylcysteine O-methyltransferase Ste14
MFTIILQVLSWLTFLLTTVLLGFWLRKYPSKKNAEKLSRILHLVFWLGVVPSIGLGVIYPGLTRFDEVLGITPLPRLSILYFAGSIMLFIGLCFFIASYVTIRLSGKGAPAFLLTKRVARIGIYRWTRNPMALGLYIGLLGFGLFLRSFYWTLGGIYVISIHIFYLKFFEEFELELRMGQPYLEYKQNVPFLVPRWKSQKL